MARLPMLLAGLFWVGTVAVQAETSDANPMDRLSFMHGVWEGTASGYDRDGPFELVQTERIGPMLDGDLLVIEGRGYKGTGDLEFNAMAVVSFNVRTEKYEMRSYAQGNSGTFEFTPTEDGYIWTVPAGPGAQVKYTATFEGDTWQQVGEYIKDGEPPRQTFQMSLTRTGDTDWPASGAVGGSN